MSGKDRGFKKGLKRNVPHRFIKPNTNHVKWQAIDLASSWLISTISWSG
ncbi:hypothetical protein P278_33400 [Zhouia amylolytica AD3]|uniref:Uncharacterized protein n=1 Tax=Zhouia amylolytica AD3 TaxID=1286632 RepID=W2UJ10_9FLAO|nr:hypothetical protein P278_33400 [Zhouia amylolytica AD3]